jgi:hypothetical protein
LAENGISGQTKNARFGHDRNSEAELDEAEKKLFRPDQLNFTVRGFVLTMTDTRI